MTKAEALQNVMDTLTGFRASQGAPSEIRIRRGDQSLTIRHGWSKSHINNGTQIVFLIAAPFFTFPSNGYPNNGNLGIIERVDYGDQSFLVSGDIVPPTEERGYWLLPVREV